MRTARVFVTASLAAAAALLAAACASQRFDGPDGDRHFYEARCGVCHVPLPRENLSAGEWQKILDVMAPRAGLVGAQRERVSQYLSER
jgi:Spy/CpxP family protein refolding chaperone